MEFKFWTKDGVAVVMRPETEEQQEQAQWMSHMWQINHLGNCGPDYAVEFAEQYQINDPGAEPSSCMCVFGSFVALTHISLDF